MLNNLSLIEHLTELRKRLLGCLISIFIFSLFAYYNADYIINLLIQPFQKLLVHSDHPHRFIYTSLPEAFLIQIKVSFWSGLICALPIILIQIWKFIAPALYCHEKSFFSIILGATFILFIGGLITAYYIVIPNAWRFFLSFEQHATTQLMSIMLEARISDYVNLAIQFLIIFGFSFQLPIILILLYKINILSFETLRNSRRYIFISILIISAILTPPDVLSMITLAVPLYLLYEITLIILAIMHRKRKSNMIDIKWICKYPEQFDQGLINRGSHPLSSQIIALDQQSRDILTHLQYMRNQRNTVAKAIGQAYIQKNVVQAAELTQQANKIKRDVLEFEQRQKIITEKLNNIMLTLPNIIAAGVPVGQNESDNQQVSIWGEIPTFDFIPLSHEVLGENLGLMNFEQAAVMSGARFTILTGQLAQLERALTDFMLDIHTKKFDYLHVSPPLLVKDNAFYGVGLLPKFAENAFRTTSDYWLIPTAEVSLTNLVADRILDAEALPLRFVAHTPCFRSEAGAAGRDTRGMIRQHQFYKVELVSIVDPQFESKEHERMTNCATTILEYLGLPYRKMLLCTGDMGSHSKKTYDLEVWLPSQRTYREISSCSMCGDYQARRTKSRFKDTNANAKTQFVATLNGSALAVGRTIVAILENYQLKNGSIKIPPVLRSYMNNQEFITSARN